MTCGATACPLGCADLPRRAAYLHTVALLERRIAGAVEVHNTAATQRLQASQRRLRAWIGARDMQGAWG